VVDELAGLRGGHTNKALGPSREKVPNRYTLMSLVGALGLAVQLVEDPEAVCSGGGQSAVPAMRITMAACPRQRCAKPGRSS
jgi:hypothetical protein